MYLGGCVSADGNVIGEINLHIVKTRARYISLGYFWRCCDVSLFLKIWIYNVSVRGVPLYAYEFWSSRAEELQRLTEFGSLCFRRIVDIH